MFLSKTKIDLFMDALSERWNLGPSRPNTANLRSFEDNKKGESKIYMNSTIGTRTRKYRLHNMLSIVENTRQNSIAKLENICIK